MTDFLPTLFLISLALCLLAPLFNGFGHTLYRSKWHVCSVLGLLGYDHLLTPTSPTAPVSGDGALAIGTPPPTRRRFRSNGGRSWIQL